jgi:hypothetical protein
MPQYTNSFVQPDQDTTNINDFGLSSFNLKTSVEWDLECVDFYFRQGAMRRNNVLLQRIVTQQKLKSGVL